MIFLQLFYTFFKIGLFGFGGGYAMLSMIQGEVVTRHDWLSSSEFTDIVAISQMTPGPIGINSATYVGYTAVVNAGYSHAIGILGSAIATCSVVLPSFILMIIISKFFLKYQKHPSVAAVFSGLRRELRDGHIRHRYQHNNIHIRVHRVAQVQSKPDTAHHPMRSRRTHALLISRFAG